MEELLEIDHPHEFSWFWHDLLKVENVDQYNPQQASLSIDLKKGANENYQFKQNSGGGLVFKPMELVGFHLPKFAELFKQAPFVYINRDPMEVALQF